MKEKIYCGLDIGSQRVKAGILRVHHADDMELLAVMDNPTQGMRDSSVTDLAELSDCIHRTIQESADKGKVRIKSVHLGISGELVESRKLSAAMPLLDKGRKVITSRDVRKVNEHARLLGMKMEEEVLHDLPQSYVIDDDNRALSPLGLYGRKMAVESLMIFTQNNRIRNLIQAVNEAGYEVSSFSFSTYAASDIVLNEQERRQGCILMDMGSQVSSILIFKEGVLKFFHKISVGGDDLTRVIAQRLGVAFGAAEEIKKEYAVAMPNDPRQGEEILLHREGQYTPVKREILFQAMEPQMVQMIQGIQEAIAASGFSGQLGRGMIMIGGGVLLSGLMERIGQETGLPVRLGHANVASSKLFQKTSEDTALCASVVGLAQYDLRKKQTSPFSSNGQRNLFSKGMNRVREWYQEYF